MHVQGNEAIEQLPAALKSLIERYKGLPPEEIKRRFEAGELSDDELELISGGGPLPILCDGCARAAGGAAYLLHLLLFHGLGVDLNSYLDL